MAVTTLLAFTLLNMSFVLIPGPDVICILSNAVSGGFRAGAATCAGIACAALVHVVACALGLTAFLAAVPAAFLAIKVTVAIYLVWLGGRMLWRPVSIEPVGRASRWSSPFAQGALTNLLNPKIALFFLAILPQFVDPALGHPGAQAAVLGLVSIISGTAVNLCTAALGGRAKQWLSSRPSFFQRFQQLAGAALVVLGVRVALDRVR